MTSTVCSSYFKDHEQDLNFIAADAVEEQRRLMMETDSEDWTGVEETSSKRPEDFLIGRLDEL